MEDSKLLEEPSGMSLTGVHRGPRGGDRLRALSVNAGNAKERVRALLRRAFVPQCGHTEVTVLCAHGQFPVLPSGQEENV